jgi:prepilin-type N-terminal cleavage/methylation domain-containing protein
VPVRRRQRHLFPVWSKAFAAAPLPRKSPLNAHDAPRPSVEPDGGTGSRGFTLIEVMAVLVILGVLAAVALKKVGAVSDTAETRMLEAGVAELNTRELMTWTNEKFATRGAIVDSAVWSAVNTDLGERYAWTTGPDAGGGTLVFESVAALLTRAPSTEATAARWE